MSVLDLESLAWTERALCAQIGPADDTFFPKKGQSTRPAKRVCLGCEARVECLQDALERGDENGVWGGFGSTQRRRIAESGREAADVVAEAEALAYEALGEPDPAAGLAVAA